MVLLGEADNWTPAEPCQAFMKGAQERGASVAVQVYPGAVHAFDSPSLPIHGIKSYRENGVIPIVGTNEAARTDARRRVRDFLAAQLQH
jgi:dienelactone hydrolase